MKRENYFEYLPPLVSELKKLGYSIPIEPTEQDTMFCKQMLNSSLCDAQPFLDLFNQWNYRDCIKPAIRTYAYYINNPQQFAHDPNNIVGSMIRFTINASASHLNHLHGIQIPYYLKAKLMLIRKFKEPMLSTLLPSAKALAKRVQHNTTIISSTDLNQNQAILTSLFR